MKKVVTRYAIRYNSVVADGVRMLMLRRYANILERPKKKLFRWFHASESETFSACWREGQLILFSSFSFSFLFIDDNTPYATPSCAHR